MSIALLDVNVLVALFDSAHPDHENAHRWFGRRRRKGWASCPLTLNGCIRVLSNPSYPTVDATPAQVVEHLSILCSSPDHHFWPDSLSILDDTLFLPRMIAGHRQITDIYLLALAVQHSGKLATFDRTIPLNAVRRATASHLEVLGTRSGP
jgi:uncharacterized protein